MDNAKCSMNEDCDELTVVFKLKHPTLSGSGNQYNVFSSHSWKPIEGDGIPPGILAANINIGFFTKLLDQAKEKMPYIKKSAVLQEDDTVETQKEV